MKRPQTNSIKRVIALPGKHVLIDYWGAKGLQDTVFIEKAMRAAAQACGATVLQVHLHQFGSGCGVTGVAILAESHITIHTWPEIEFAALDIFMCGQCDPSDAIAPLAKLFLPKKTTITEVNRGPL
ncbi:MAG: adenosylmethionine decarboxylase [Mariprofundaceae bacterium]|nr:adenosylmethionine decarboxylase [Mariprofundaceae bacterium]